MKLLAISRHQVEILLKCREARAVIDLMVIAGLFDRTKFRNQVLAPLNEADLIELAIGSQRQPALSACYYRYGYAQ
jgi:hypothetical protein